MVGCDGVSVRVTDDPGERRTVFAGVLGRAVGICVADGVRGADVSGVGFDEGALCSEPRRTPRVVTGEAALRSVFATAGELVGAAIASEGLGAEVKGAVPGERPEVERLIDGVREPVPSRNRFRFDAAGGVLEGAEPVAVVLTLPRGDSSSRPLTMRPPFTVWLGGR